MQTDRRFRTFRPYLIPVFIFLCVLLVNSKPHHRHSSVSKLEWGEWNKCPIDSFVAGISLRLRDSEKKGSSPKITGVRLYCTRKQVLSERDDDFVETIIQVDTPEGQPSKWYEPVFCSAGVATEFKVKYAAINGHQTVTNLRLVCSDGETLKTHGHGKDKGDSTESFVCPPRHAICGLQTRVLPEVEHGDNVLMDAKVHCCDVKNPATHCALTDKWQFVTDCINSESIFPETCGFEKRIGTSYAGKEKETQIYENLGFTLNGVATDLSTKAHEVMENRSPSDYNWGNVNSNVWMPETRTNDTVIALPQFKLQVFQLVGYCGFYRVRSSEFRQNATEVLKTPSGGHAKPVGDLKMDSEKESINGKHDPNIQSDFSGFDDDDGWGSDSDDDEPTADDKGAQEEKKEDSYDKKQESDESAEAWGDSAEEKQEDGQSKKQESDELFEAWGDSAEEKKPVKKDQNEEPSDPDKNSEEDKPAKTMDQKQESIDDDGFEDFSDEKKSEEAKDDRERSKESEEVNKSADDLFGSEENKSKAQENDYLAPILPTIDTKADEEQNEDGFEDSDDFDYNTDSHDTKTDNSPAVAPTPEEKLHEKEVSDKEDSENDKIWDPKPTDTETDADDTLHHEPLTKEESDFEREDQWNIDSEEGTHEETVNNAHPSDDLEKNENSKSDSLEEDNKNSKDEVIGFDKQEESEQKPVEVDKNRNEMMAKDQPNDEDVWDDFGNVENGEHGHKDHDSHEVEVNTNEKSQDIVKENLKIAETEPPVTDDEYDLFDGFSVDIPESNFNEFARQVGEPKQNEESSNNDKDHAGTILGDPTGFISGAVNNVVQSVQENIAPLADELEKTIDDIKEMPIVKDPHKTISELLDSADTKDDEPTHQDNDNDEVAEQSNETEDAPSADENQGEPPKVQSAVLGYIVGGMVALVVIIVVIIFVLERRKTDPKRFPQEADKISGGVRDPPLLSGYRKGSTESPRSAAVSEDKDAF